MAIEKGIGARVMNLARTLKPLKLTFLRFLKILTSKNGDGSVIVGQIEEQVERPEIPFDATLLITSTIVSFRGFRVI